VDVVRGPLAETEKRFDACFVGRLVKSKGILDLAAVWEIVCAERRGARLVVVGEGADRAKLESAVKGFRLEKNILLTGLLGEERFTIMRESRILLLPSYGESWPLVVVEALSCGLPVVAYDVPDLRALWEATISLVELGNVEAFSRRVIDLLANQEQRNSFASRGIEISGTLLWAAIATRELEALGNL